jgi:hypothetical protein
MPNSMTYEECYDIETVIFFKNCKEFISVFLTYEDHLRLRDNLQRIDLKEKDLNPISHFISKTVDGYYIGICIFYVQAVRFLLQAKFLTPKINSTEEIKILLHAREACIEIIETLDHESLYEFFWNLDNALDVDGSFLHLVDEDDEEIYINVSELMYIESPLNLVRKGKSNPKSSVI